MQAHVSNFLSPRSGRPVANQFRIETPAGVFFQSYDKIIAYRPWGGVIQLDEYYWDYSNTTTRYRNEFLGENTKETRAKIKRGEYVLTDLNKPSSEEDHYYHKVQK